MASMASKAAPMASTFCTEYSAFVQGIIKGARVYLEDKPPETPFGLPDLPFHGAPPESEYDLRRMVLLERLIDRMIFDKLIVPAPKSRDASRTRYLFHPDFDSAKGFGRLTGAAWIRCFWFGLGFDQAVADGMTSIEGFLNREVVSQGISNVKIKTELISSQAIFETPVRGSKDPRANSNASDSSSGSDPSSPVPIFSSTQRAASNYSASSPPDLEQRTSPSIALAPTLIPKSSYTGPEKTPKVGKERLLAKRASNFVPYQVESACPRATWSQGRMADRMPEEHIMLIESMVNTIWPDEPWNRKEPERSGRRSFSDADLRASPITAPEVDLVSEFSLPKGRDNNGKGQIMVGGARQSEIPAFIFEKLLDFQTLYPDDSIHVTAESNILGELIMTWKCDDCTGLPYPLDLRDHDLTDLSGHLQYSGHIAQVYGRPNLKGQIATVTSAVKRRMDQLRRGRTTVGLYCKLVNQGAPPAKGYPEPFPISRPSVPSSILSSSGSSFLTHDSTPATSRSVPAGSSSKEPYFGLEDAASQTPGQIQANTSTAGPVPKEFFTEEYKLVIDDWIQKVRQHSSTLNDQTKSITEQNVQVQQTMQMLGDILDTSATQNTALERMRTDTTDWMKDLEEENKKQKAKIDRLRLELRTQRDQQKAFEANTEARFARMVQDNKAQLALVMNSIRRGDKGNTPKELGVPQIDTQMSPRKRARHM